MFSLKSFFISYSPAKSARRLVAQAFNISTLTRYDLTMGGDFYARKAHIQILDSNSSGATPEKVYDVNITLVVTENVSTEFEIFRDLEIHGSSIIFIYANLIENPQAAWQEVKYLLKRINELKKDTLVHVGVIAEIENFALPENLLSKAFITYKIAGSKNFVTFLKTDHFAPETFLSFYRFLIEYFFKMLYQKNVKITFDTKNQSPPSYVPFFHIELTEKLHKITKWPTISSIPKDQNFDILSINLVPQPYWRTAYKQFSHYVLYHQYLKHMIGLIEKALSQFLDQSFEEIYSNLPKNLYSHIIDKFEHAENEKQLKRIIQHDFSQFYDEIDTVFPDLNTIEHIAWLIWKKITTIPEYLHLESITQIMQHFSKQQPITTEFSYTYLYHLIRLLTTDAIFQRIVNNEYYSRIRMHRTRYIESTRFFYLQRLLKSSLPEEWKITSKDGVFPKAKWTIIPEKEPYPFEIHVLWENFKLARLFVRLSCPHHRRTPEFQPCIVPMNSLLDKMTENLFLSKQNVLLLSRILLLIQYATLIMKNLKKTEAFIKEYYRSFPIDLSIQQQFKEHFGHCRHFSWIVH